MLAVKLASVCMVGGSKIRAFLRQEVFYRISQVFWVCLTLEFQCTRCNQTWESSSGSGILGSTGLFAIYFIYCIF